jgi:site-specific recombinase XerD
MKRKPPFRHVREVEAFLEMLQAERGASKNTLLAYAATWPISSHSWRVASRAP